MVDTDQLQPCCLDLLEGAQLGVRFHAKETRTALNVGDAECPLHPAALACEQPAGFLWGAPAHMTAHGLQL